MDTEVASVLNDWSDYEFNGVTRHLLDALLNYVVSILVVDAVEHAVLELGHEQLLLVELNDLEGLLDYSAAVHGLGELEHVLQQLVGQVLPVLLGAVLEQLLDHVVAEDVVHQAQRVRQDLVKDQFLLLGCSGVVLLLDEPRPVLVQGALHYVPLQLRDLYLSTVLDPVP